MGFTLGGWTQFGGGSVLADLVGQAVVAGSFAPTSATVPTNGLYLPFAGVPGFSANGSAILTIGGGVGVDQLITTGIGFRTATASGGNGFVFTTAGARLKFSSGGTTDYLSSDGLTLITAAGDFAATTFRLGTSQKVSWPAGGGYLTADIGGSVAVNTGVAGTTANIGGNLNTQSTPVSNASTTETTLFTYDLPISTMTTTNRGVRVTCYGSNTGSATTKTLRFYFGALLQTVVLPITNAGDWELVATIVRTGASAQRYAIRLGEENDASATVASWTVTQGTTAQTETAAITIKVTGQDSVGAGTVTANLWSVDAI